MKQNTILISVITLLIGGIGGYIIANNSNDDYNGREGMMSNQATEREQDSDMAGTHMMPDGTMMGNNMPMENMGSMDHSMMMVTSEREFVTGMIPHHQEAVDTATEVLARGGSTEEIRTLATDIIAAQEREITMLKKWHLAWYGEAYAEDGKYQPMMRDLSQLEGAALDKRFLEDMIPHHMGAIMMAQSVRPHIEHQEITEMVAAIMSTQTAEIELMKNMLTKL
jgi:uncharacterized protein (DUF305 family)